MMVIYCTIFITIFISNINGDTESVHSHSKDDQRTYVNSDYWKNYHYALNSLYPKYREAKSNNEPFYSEPNNNEQYESVPNTIAITAIPTLGGLGGIGGLGGLGGLGGIGGGLGGLGGLGGGLGGFGGGLGGGYGGLGHGHHGWGYRPVYLINKKSDWFSWLIPLLLILGAPLLMGIILIPVVLKSCIFLLQILRNLGILLPITAALAGTSSATITQATG